MAKKIQDGNQIVTNVDSNDNLTFSIKDSFIDSTPTINSTNLVTSGGVKSALDINTTDIAAAVVRIANNETNISNHTSAIQALDGRVSTNTTDIDSLETTVGTLSTNVNTNTTNIGSLSNLTTTNKTSLVNAVNEINAPEKWISVGAEAPENGERVWFKKGKNLFDGKLELGSYNGSGVKQNATDNYRNVNIIPVKPNTTYTFSINGVSQKYCLYFYDINHSFISENLSLTTGTFTSPNNAYFVNFRSFSADFVSDFTNLKVQLEEGPATTYEQYIEPSINVDEEEWYIKPKVLWTGRATSVAIDLRGYSFIEVIFCSNDNFYNSLKVPVSGSTFSRKLTLCNNYMPNTMESSSNVYLKYGQATLTQAGITINSNVEIPFSNTAGQIRWQGASNTLLYITTIIGYK